MKFLLPIAVVAVAFVIGTRSLTVGFPFMMREVHLGENERSLLAVVTYGEISRGEARQFFTELEASMNSISENEGLVGYAVRKQFVGPKVWTISVWEDEDALRDFVRSEVHRNASRNGTIVPGSFRSTFFEVEISDLPISWKVALSELKKVTSHDPKG
ncbi:MAG: antibiotic biosynthesis monooxygenase [Verrucomicrobiota bacterium]